MMWWSWWSRHTLRERERCSVNSHSGCGHNFVFIALLCISALLWLGVSVKSFEYKSHTDTEACTTGYVAEWEFLDEAPATDADNLKVVRSPLARIDPAFWQDSAGAWWLHGGRSERDGNLADLWTFEPDSTSKHGWHWRLVFQPDPGAISSSFPEPSINPILCGSIDGNTIAVYARTAADAEGSNSLFDDNLVWIYKIPQSKSNAAVSHVHGETEAETFTAAGDEGIWTSYMCCDVCDPTPPDAAAAAGPVNEKTNKTTTNLEFCPHFSQSTTIVSKDTELNSGREAVSAGKSSSKVEQELENAEAERKVNTESGIKVEPILWCAQDSLMALQLTFTKSQNSVSHEGTGTDRDSRPPRPLLPQASSNKRSEKVSKELRESYSREEIESATFPSTTKIHLSDHNTVSPAEAAPPHPTAYNEFPTTSNPTSTTTSSRTITESQRAFQQSRIQKSTQTGAAKAKISSKDKNNSESTLQRTKNLEETIPKYLNWWKFNLATTEWEKLPQPQVIMGAAAATSGIKDPDSIYKLFDPRICRPTSDSIYVYIFCVPEPETSGTDPGQAQTARDVYLFNPSTSTISKIPAQIRLNVLFSDDSRMWTRRYSALNALRLPELNKTVIMIAYSKLIDFWIHDHRTNAISSAENVWRGPTLDRFQHHDSFYRLRISVLNCTREHNVFLPNPRHMTDDTGHHELIFNDTSSCSAATAAATRSNPCGWFHVKLETDENIFLPSRDTSFMINVDGEDDGNGMEQEEQQQNSAIENPITTAANTTTLISPLPRTSFSKVEVEAEAFSGDAPAAAVPAEQFPNEKEKIQFNSHSKLHVEVVEPRATPLLVNSNNGSKSTTSLENHDDAVIVIGKFNLNNLPSSSSSSSSAHTNTEASTNGGQETSSEGTTFIKFNNVVLSSLSQQKLAQNVFRENLNRRKKVASIFNDWTHINGTQYKKSDPQAKERGQHINQNEKAMNQTIMGQTTTTRLIMSPDSDSSSSGQLEPAPQINNASTVNIATITNSESLEPEVEISVRQSTDDSDSLSPFSPSLELKLANTVVQFAGSNLGSAGATDPGPGRNENLLVDNAVIDNNYSKSESVVDENNESAGAHGGSSPISDSNDYGSSNTNEDGVEARSLWKLASTAPDDHQPLSWSYPSILFYALSVTIFAATGVLLFVRKCAKCSGNGSWNAEKSDEHALCSESRSKRAAATSGSGEQTDIRRLPEEFYLNTPIV